MFCYRHDELWNGLVTLQCPVWVRRAIPFSCSTVSWWTTLGRAPCSHHCLCPMTPVSPSVWTSQQWPQPRPLHPPSITHRSLALSFYTTGREVTPNCCVSDWLVFLAQNVCLYKCTNCLWPMWEYKPIVKISWMFIDSGFVIRSVFSWHCLQSRLCDYSTRPEQTMSPYWLDQYLTTD